MAAGQGHGAAAGGAFTLEDITWPAVTGLLSYVLFVATQDDLICAQATGALTAGSNNTDIPGSITFGGPLVRSTWALPSPYVSKVRLKAKHLIHGGLGCCRFAAGLTQVPAQGESEAALSRRRNLLHTQLCHGETQASRFFSHEGGEGQRTRARGPAKGLAYLTRQAAHRAQGQT